MTSASCVAGVEFKDRAVQGVTYDPIGEIEDFEANTLASSDTLQLLASVCSLCNEARIEYKDGSYQRMGEPTEAALKVLAEKMATADAGTADIEVFNNLFARDFEELCNSDCGRSIRSLWRVDSVTIFPPSTTVSPSSSSIGTASP